MRYPSYISTYIFSNQLPWFVHLDPFRGSDRDISYPTDWYDHLSCSTAKIYINHSDPRCFNKDPPPKKHEGGLFAVFKYHSVIRKSKFPVKYTSPVISYATQQVEQLLSDLHLSHGDNPVQFVSYLRIIIVYVLTLFLD